MTVHQDVQSVLRVEDGRLLQGRARFVDDIHLDRMVHAVFVRSPIAHAEIATIDPAPALAAGALCVLTAKDLPFIGETLIVRFWHPSIRNGLPKLMALDRVRYVGEPVALVIAEDRYRAEDLAALVAIEYRPLDPVPTIAAALAPSASQIHEIWPGNIAANFTHALGDADAALSACTHRLSRRFVYARQTPLPLETRGCVADFDTTLGTLTAWVSTQTHYNVRHNLAQLLKIPEYDVRVICSDVGGGFGAKSRPYAEEILVSHASRVLGRPVKWIEDRFENLVATTHSRGTETDITIGFDDQGHIRALKGRLHVDIGAYVFTSGIVTAEVASGHCAGPYKIPNIALDVICVGTNKTPLATYRGAGQPEATFPIECMLDLVGRKLGLTAPEVRRRNLVAPADMPYVAHIPYGGPKSSFDSGDYPAMVAKAAALSGYREQIEELPDGRRIAWGMACGIESTGFIGFESAKIKIDVDGNVTVWSGLSSQGQGQVTTFAQVCAETLGVDADKVSVRMGDTQLVPFGRGAFASRGAVVGANAVAGAASRLREKVLNNAGTLLQKPPGSLTVEHGRIRFAQGDATILTLGDIAKAVAPGAPLYGGDLALEEQFIFDTGGALTFAMSTHAVKVALDPRTGFYEIIEYFVVHDAGRMLNRRIAEGQIIGGVAEGLSCAMLAEIAYDDQAQPMTMTLADYMVASATELPHIRLEDHDIRATTNPLGVRGVGEGGVIPVGPALVNALSRAIQPTRIGHEQLLFRLPLKPEAVLAACKAVERDVTIAAR